MKKFLTFVFLATTIAPFIHAQYVIPDAQKQPAWVFPLFFEEGTGKRDTIYLGYDKNAVEMGIPSADTVYGMKWNSLDTNRFNVFYGYSNKSDSIYKVLVQNKYFGGGVIEFYKGVLPLKVKWDINLLRSDTLPFSDQKPLPRAQIEWNYGNGTIDMNDTKCNFSLPVLITDTALNSSYSTCIRKDSMMFYDMFNRSNIQIAYMGFGVNPWTGYLTGIERSQIKNKIELFPIPASTHISVQLNNFNAAKISISDMLGITLKSLDILGSGNISFDVSEIPTGIYFMHFHSVHTVSKKIIIIK